MEPRSAADAREQCRLRLRRLRRFDGAASGNTSVTDESLAYSAIGNTTYKNGAMTFSPAARPTRSNRTLSLATPSTPMANRAAR